MKFQFLVLFMCMAVAIMAMAVGVGVLDGGPPGMTSLSGELVADSFEDFATIYSLYAIPDMQAKLSATHAELVLQQLNVVLGGRPVLKLPNESKCSALVAFNGTDPRGVMLLM